jgi:hypothetical protein
MSIRYLVRWHNNKGESFEKYYKDEASSKRVYSRKRNEKVLKTTFCERAWYGVGKDYEGDDIEHTIDGFRRDHFMGLPLPRMVWEVKDGEVIE